MSQNFNLAETAFLVLKNFLPFLFAICFHEFAHGWVARLRGDRTAETMGRLTMNPMAHADPIGTIILPIVSILTQIPLFGWAKPVPVDERNLKNPKSDMFWIALAGPLSNMLLALIGAVALGFFYRFFADSLHADNPGLGEIHHVLRIFIIVNVFLAVFNLLPIHPLDGGKVIARFLPDSVNRQLEEWQSYTSMLLLVLFVTGSISIITGPALWVNRIFMSLATGVASV